MKHLSLVLFLALGSAVVGCGNQGSAADGADSTASASVAVDQKAAAPGEAAQSAIPPKSKYVVKHDPNAIYTEDDLPAEGNFLKLNFVDLDPKTMNRVIHRFKTEHTPCESESCHLLMYEEALVTEPQCDITLRAAKNVIREEKMRSGNWNRDGQ